MKKKTPKQVHNNMYAKEVLKVTSKLNEYEAAEFLMQLVEGVEQQHPSLSIGMIIDNDAGQK